MQGPNTQSENNCQANRSLPTTSICHANGIKVFGVCRSHLCRWLLAQGLSHFPRFFLASSSLQMPFPPSFKSLSQKGSVHGLTKRDLLMLQHLDDVNPVGIGWSHSDLVSFNISAMHYFCKHGLRRKKTKPSPLDQVITTQLHFIGWSWHLADRNFRPNPVKLHEYLSLTARDKIYTQNNPLIYNQIIIRKAHTDVTQVTAGSRIPKAHLPPHSP